MHHSKYSVITPAGTYVTTINPRLVAKQGISDAQLDVIKDLHVTKFLCEEAMKTAPVETLKTSQKFLVKIDKSLQLAWGFEYNPNMYRFWDVPRCECPKWDNSDSYPSGYYIINKSCPVHGGDDEE